MNDLKKTPGHVCLGAIFLTTHIARDSLCMQVVLITFFLFFKSQGLGVSKLSNLDLESAIFINLVFGKVHRYWSLDQEKVYCGEG